MVSPRRQLQHSIHDPDKDKKDSTHQSNLKVSALAVSVF